MDNLPILRPATRSYHKVIRMVDFNPHFQPDKCKLKQKMILVITNLPQPHGNSTVDQVV